MNNFQVQGEKKMRLIAGVVQFDVLMGRIDKNVEKALINIERLSAHGCNLAVLPEMWSSGFDYEGLEKAAFASADVLQQISLAARKNNIVVSGSLPEIDGGKIYNTMYTVNSSGEIIAKYRKVHLFTLTGEDQHFGAGEKSCIVDIGGMDAGNMICYDIRFPELARTLVTAGAKIIVVSAQWPEARCMHWDTLLRARAIENQVYIIASNRCGADEKLLYAGNSCIISPMGDILQNAGKHENIIMAEINTDIIDEVRNTIPCLLERKHAVYAL
jgi:predicted amidohydrolase